MYGTSGREVHERKRLFKIWHIGIKHHARVVASTATAASPIIVNIIDVDRDATVIVGDRTIHRKGVGRVAAWRLLCVIRYQVVISNNTVIDLCSGCSVGLP